MNHVFVFVSLAGSQLAATGILSALTLLTLMGLPTSYKDVVVVFGSPLAASGEADAFLIGAAAQV